MRVKIAPKGSPTAKTVYLSAMSGEFVVDASDLNLAPDQWPECLNVWRIEGCPPLELSRQTIEAVADGGVESVLYVGPGMHLRVLN